ncbi:hypothetical protein [Streptomyces aidingensis]|uniref:Uncharacterized protein n=1 Tax=Streptomyces aidingensis TaxID=910347 RepID=A0A1I1JFJ4_9ACTN|nr:hypothetical protein [Streptomyces aidingensis]SFC47226.1 hypothetical protein SAMN05421773_103397 [Streptomyces aidingensis]
MRRRLEFLRARLASPAGLLLLAASVSGSLALGMLPTLVQEVPRIGGSFWWLALVALAAVLVLGYCWSTLYYREGVGLVLYLGRPGQGWDEHRVELMRADAMDRHARCFTVSTGKLLEGQPDPGAADPVALAYQVIQARLAEEAADRGPVRSVSLYLTARLHQAYALGRRLKDQRHERLTLMDLSRTPGGGVFPALTLDSRPAEPPTAERDGPPLARVLDRPLGDPLDIRVFGRATAPDGTPAGEPPARCALIVSVAGNPSMVQEALRAARTGESGDYRFPGGGGPEAHRCAAALVIDTRPGHLDSRPEVFEAFVQYVAHHWKAWLKQWGEERRTPVRGLLFTDAPGPVVTALGGVLGSGTDFVPHRSAFAPPPRPAGPPAAGPPAGAPGPAATAGG